MINPATASAPLPPLLPGPWPMGHYQGLKKDPLSLLLRAAESLGDVLRLRVGTKELVLLRNPEQVKYVLQDHQRNFSKNTRGYSVMRRFLGNGLVTSEGDFWLRQRRIAQPGFHRQRIAHFARVMVELTQEMLARWESTVAHGETLDISKEMMALTLRIVGKTLLSSDVREDTGSVGPALTELLRQVIGRSMSVVDVPIWVPTSANRRFHAARKALDDIVFRIIADRRQTGADVPDLLSMLIHARDEETGEGMTDLQLRDELMTMVLAGHETTANALAWTFQLLAQNPEWARRVEDEVDGQLRGSLPALEHLPRLPLTQAVIQEGMRLYPPVWLLMRYAETDDVLGGYRVPAGTFVACCQWVIHRNPAFFPEPERFDPERFIGERAERIPRFAYFPFSGGPRVCIGNSFAMMEAQLALACITQRFRLQLLPGYRPDPEPTVTLRPRHGLPMRVEPRRSLSVGDALGSAQA